MVKNKWFLTFKQNSCAKTRIFCFHHSGGGASAYFPWVKQLSSSLELVAIQLPGREDRFSETLVNNIDDIVSSLNTNFLRYMDKPFFIFGHSLGALLGFEFAKSVQQKYNITPQHIIVSATKAPHLPLRRKNLSQLDLINLKEELTLYNGIDKDILNNEELFNLFIPIFRNDFLLYEKYKCLDLSPLFCDMTTLSGTFDQSVKEEEILAWEKYTQGQFKHISFPGDHFFVKQFQKEIVEIINQIAEKYIL